MKTWSGVVIISVNPQKGLGQRTCRLGRRYVWFGCSTHYPVFVEYLADAGQQLPSHVRQAFESYLQCGRLEHGFLRLRCDTCHTEHLLAFSCGARRMVDGAAWLIDQVLPERPIRQWGLSLPFPY